MKNRIVSLFLCFATVFTMIPFGVLTTAGGEVSTEDASSSDTTFVNYGAAIGNTATFNVERTVNFLVFSDPAEFDYDADWDNDDNWLYYLGPEKKTILQMTTSL